MSLQWILFHLIKRVSLSFSALATPQLCAHSFDLNVFLSSAPFSGVLTCSLCSAHALQTHISPLTLFTVFLSIQPVLAVHDMVSNPCPLVSVGSHARGQLNGLGQKGHKADGLQFQSTDGSSEYSEDGPAKKRWVVLTYTLERSFSLRALCSAAALTKTEWR